MAAGEPAVCVAPIFNAVTRGRVSACPAAMIASAVMMAVAVVAALALATKPALPAVSVNANPSARTENVAMTVVAVIVVTVRADSRVTRWASATVSLIVSIKCAVAMAAAVCADYAPQTGSATTNSSAVFRPKHLR